MLAACSTASSAALPTTVSTPSARSFAISSSRSSMTTNGRPGAPEVGGEVPPDRAVADDDGVAGGR